MPPGRKRKVNQLESTECGGPSSDIQHMNCNMYSASQTNSCMRAAPSSSRGKGLATLMQEMEAERPRVKRAKRVKDKETSAPEKRGAIFKRACPKNIYERVERVRGQRFYMIDRKREGNQLKEEFSVLGSTGNVYTVVIDKKPSCNCPDASRGNHCKHILFIYLKVLQVPESSHTWYQKALVTKELEEIFRNAPTAPNAMADLRVRNAYAKATGKTSSPQASSSQPTKKRIPGEDDDCPICYEGLHGIAEKNLTWCETCGNSIHNECFQQWARTKGRDLTCVFCRAKLVGPGSIGGEASTSEGYLNLSDVAGISPIIIVDAPAFLQVPMAELLGGY